MSFRTFRYCLKEGFINVFRNKVMSIASISTIAASLILFGVFIILTANLEYNSIRLQKQPQMEVFCSYELDEAQLTAIYDAIDSNKEVKDWKIISKKEAYDKAREMFADDASLLEGLGYEYLPVSFVINVKNPDNSQAVADYFRSLPGVDSVSYSKRMTYIISSIVKWIKYFSAFLMIIFTIFSVLIIANTVRLAMFARRKEIGIMKYIGATDWFIRCPFIVEGLIIGIIGSGIGFILIIYLYKFTYVNYVKTLEGVIQLLSVRTIASQVAIFYLILGIFVGSLGSVISIRKYLRV